MSIPAEKAAWSMIESGGFKLTPAEKVVLLKVAFWTNGDWECWHGAAKLAVQCDLSRDSVIKALKKLARCGVLSKRPQAKHEGRGRAPDVIVFDPAAKSGLTALSFADQSRVFDAAESDLTPQQSRVSTPPTNKSSERTLENSSERREEEAIGNRRRNLPLPSVGRLKVTEHELSLAAAALAQFNLRNGSRLKLLGRANGATESLKRIVERLRENEEITAEELREIVSKSFDNPYWSGPAKVGNIFGPKAFQGAIVNDGIARSSRTVRRDIDRKPGERRRKGPDW